MAGSYALYKYIELFSSESFGKWVIGAMKENGDNYIRMPHVLYQRNVDSFIHDVHACYEKSGIDDYIKVLQSYGIEWRLDDMIRADIQGMPREVLISLLLGAVRAEKYVDGAIFRLLKNGVIQKWLSALKEMENGMSRIMIDDLLRLSDREEASVKIKFNQNNGNEDPMDLYLRDPEIVNHQWLFWRNKQRYFNVGQIAVCFLKLGYDTWLLTTVKRVTKELGVVGGVNYEGEELLEYSQYFGRVIIKYHKTAQTQGMFYRSVFDELEVLEILPGIYDGDEFPGYDNVSLSYARLSLIVERKRKSWITALENQKAVYLITDKSNGKLYVGSATSDNGMLLSRWSDYIANGHGGNVKLKKLVTERGFDYVKANFQYSILENYNSRVDDKVILKRESWWKEVLKSREFGYNDN